MNFLHRTPFFRLLLPLIAGIIFFQFFYLKDFVLCLVFVSAILLFISGVFTKNIAFLYKFRWVFGAGVFVFLFGAGYELSKIREDNNKISISENTGIYAVELTKPPVEKAGSYKCEVTLLEDYNQKQFHKASGKAILYIQKDTNATHLLYGDKLIIKANFCKPPGAVNPDGFNYSEYLKKQGVSVVAFVPFNSWELLDCEQSFSLFKLADICRTKLLAIYHNFHIVGDEFAVLAALTLGYTDDLQPELMKGYSATGAMHILSVSGLHVGIIYVVFAFLIARVFKNEKFRFLRAFIVVLFLWVYAFLTGLSPSVIRSALMFSLVAVGKSINRQSEIYNTVFFSAFVMLLINPDYLFNVGFQLSYAAVLSIVYFQQPISQLVPVKNRFLRWIRDLVAVSIAAQLGTLPVTLFYFQQFPNYFLLTNIVAIPLSTVVIYNAIALIIFSFVPYLSVFLAFTLKWFVWLLNTSIISIQHFPYSISVISLDFFQLILAFITLIGISAYLYVRNFGFLFAGLVSALLLLTISVKVKWETLHSSKIIVYSAKSTQINFIDHGKVFALSGDTTELEKIASPFWKRHMLEKPVRILWSENQIIHFEDKTFFIPDDYWWKNCSVGKAFPVDYLIIGNKAKPKMKYLLRNFKPGKVIIDNTISEWYKQTIKDACTINKIPVYSIADKGAFVLTNYK